MIILVVGMHRSGTSMVARALHGMGINLGERVDIAPHPANPNGHWEHADVWHTQENLLIDFGREWHSSPGPLPLRWLEWPETGAAVDLFATIAREEIARHGHWLVKDPRSSLLLPLWTEVASRLGVQLRVLHVFRNCAEVTASLNVRQGMPHLLARKIWVEHQRAIERDAFGWPCARFDYRDIMRDPVAQLAAMGGFCGLPDADERAFACAGLVEQSLWHHRRVDDPDVPAAPMETLSLPAFVEPVVSVDRGRVLIVVRTRWRLHLLPRALRSVLAQTYRHWVVQVVNDGGPAHLVESEVAPYRHLFEGRLSILHLPRQFGLEAASNLGMAAQDSEFIAIHDDDDAWRPEFLEQMTQWLETTGAMAAVSRVLVVREAWNGARYVASERTPFGPDLACITPDDLRQSNLFPPIALLFRRSVLDRVGGFEEALPALGDWHFNKRLAQVAPISVCSQDLAMWHLRLPHEGAPNSALVDHRRSYEYVRAWPESSVLPEFFARARQVVLHGGAARLDGFVQEELEDAAVSPVAPGLYLIGLALPETGKDLNFHYSSGDALTLRESTPLVCSGSGSTWVLLNAAQPIRAMGVSVTGGEVTPLPAGTVKARLADPLPCLQDLAGSPRLPDVLCIGAQRAGTTWLHALLQSHPEVWRCGIKEFHQFDWDGIDPGVGEFRQMQALAVVQALASATGLPDRDLAVRMALRHAFPVGGGWENYAASVAAAPRDRLVCDFTPAYATLDARKVEEIIRVMPDVRVIFILRDPVVRSVSGALQQLQRAGQRVPDEAQLHAACEAESNVLRTDYLRTLALWEAALPAQQLLVLFHEELAVDPVHWVGRVCNFLGIEPLPDSQVSMHARELLNTGDSLGLPWPVLARVKASLSRRWVPMLHELEKRFGEPVRQWRLAAQARIQAAELAGQGAGAGGENSVGNNLAQWDWLDPWVGAGDQWTGQAHACGVSYDEWKQALLDRYLHHFSRGGTLLEIGPGHGRWSEWLISHGGLLVCCDISPNCLDVCRQRLAGRGRLRTHVSVGDDLPADLTARVDGVWSYDCFVHLDPQQCRNYLREIARVLVPGGHAVIHHANRTGRLARWIDWLHKLPSGSVAEVRPGWRSGVNARAFRRWAVAAGLHVVRQESRWEATMSGVSKLFGVPRFGDCITVLRRDRA